MDRTVKGIIALIIFVALILIAAGLLWGDPKNKDAYMGIGSIVVLIAGVLIPILKKNMD